MELAKRLRALEKRLDQLEKENARLKAKNQELEDQLAKAKKTSRNSSKPPSSDIVNPSKTANNKQKAGKGKKKKRKIGAQPGHPRHQRPAFQDEEIDCFVQYYHERCPCCGGELCDDLEAAVKTKHQIELNQVQATVTEHYAHSQRCVDCDKVHQVEWPADLRKAGLVGPRLTAFLAYLKGPCHMSYGAIKKFLRDVVGVRLSRGQICKLVGKVSNSLGDSYEELLLLLVEQDFLNVDETGHKENGRRLWTWCFKASMFTLFKISPSRGSEVLIETLGREFDGVIGCDYFSAYRKFMRLNDNVLLQFCLAHLIRDIRFLAEHPNKRNRVYGERLLSLFRGLFRTIHDRDQFVSEAAFRDELHRYELEITWAATENVDTSEMYNMAERFVQHGESYFRFITTPGIEPTNNTAEQAIRFVAIHRRLTQGTRSKNGQSWFERICTAVVTCQQQGRSVFEFLVESVINYFRGDPGPSLIPDTS